MYVIVAIMSLLPKNILSFLVGKFCRLEFSPNFQEKLLRAFAKLTRIDLNEAEKDIREYRSIEELFGRRLKAGLRPIEGAIVSPADGMLISQKVRHHNIAVQAKGLLYELGELVYGSTSNDRDAEYSWYTGVYLAPHNYHRVHAPVGGRLTAIRYIPGHLWPVSLGFAGVFPRLFVVNERLVFDISTEFGMVHVVMVGATNVGRMKTPYLEQFVTNQNPFQVSSGHPNEYPMDPPVQVNAGDELGTFLLGSTVIAVFEKGFPVENLAEVEIHAKVKMGRSLLRSVALLP